MNQINRLSSNWLAYKINNQSFTRHLGELKGRVLDLGCGNSPYRQEILNVSDEYIGLDWFYSFHKQTSVDIISDLSKPMPIRSDSVDTITAFQVIEHLPEPSKLLSECFRVLRSNSLMLITVPFNWHIHEAPYDYYRFTRYGLEYLLCKNGFSDIHIEENTGFWQMWILKINYQTVRYARGVFKFLFIPFWFLGQVVAPVLDQYDHNPHETADYTVTARKP